MAQAIFSPLQKTKIGSEPVVVLPMRKWKEIEDALEDAEMYASDNLRKDIAKARKDRRTVSLEDLLRKYNL